MILTCSWPTSRVNDHDGSVCTGVYPAIACREMSVLHEHDKEHGPGEMHSNFAKQQWVCAGATSDTCNCDRRFDAGYVVPAIPIRYAE